MDAVTALAQLKDLGLGILVFYMWYMQNQKDASQKSVIAQQVEIISQLREDKQKESELSRLERTEFILIVKENTAALQRNSDQLQQIKCI